ncbi:ROK family protein [Candidatus Amesbacteria bacterium]|nr:ROK family protein [Candidatus Amesbacteria bacterium]
MFVVFDIGGSQTRVGVSWDGKRLDEMRDGATRLEYGEGIKLLLEMIDDLGRGEKIEAVAGGIAGVWDKSRTRIVKSPNLPDWEDKNIKQDLENKLGGRVTLENDAALGGLGEAVFGAGVGEERVAYLACGTGVGGARIVNQKIDVAAEPGQMIMKSNLESLIGGRSLQKKYGKRVEEIDDVGVWEEITDNLASGIVNVIVMWTPDAVILGGSLIKSIDVEKLKTTVLQKLTIYPWVPRMVRAKLGDQAGLWGGLALLGR